MELSKIIKISSISEQESNKNYTVVATTLCYQMSGRGSVKFLPDRVNLFL